MTLIRPKCSAACNPNDVSGFRKAIACWLYGWLAIVAVWGQAALAGTTEPAAVEADLLLTKGTIFDGTGEPGRTGDVAVRGDRIVAVGNFSVRGNPRVVDCTGLVIAPGFIDLHTHSDRSITKDKTRVNLNYLTQGCTTVVTGNCGSGPGDTKEYFDQLERDGAGTNVIHLVPHGAVRRKVMNNANRPPTPAELERMKGIVDDAMRQGAWGLSTGLIYEPSCYADTDELVELAKVVARHGGLYASHIRGEGDSLCDSVREAIAIGRRAGLPVHISHFKSAGMPNWGRLREAAEIIEEARRDGQVVTADQYPYVASSTSLAATLLPEADLRGGRSDLLQRMEKDADFRQRVRQLIGRQLARSKAIVIDSCKIPEYNGRALRDIAEQQQIDVIDLVLQIHQRGSATVVNFSMSEDDVRFGMTLPWVATASDGWARLADPAARFHPRNFGTFPRKIGRYAGREHVIGMPQAIRSCTGLPADILGLTDRGYLREGAVADVLVFHPDEFIDRATFEQPAEYTTGVKYLYIAGNLALQGTAPSEKLHGRLIRHRSADQGDAWQKIAPHFSPPDEWAGQFGDYRSPLRFADDSEVRSADDWPRRRAEILSQWHELMGQWPPLITDPEVEVLDSTRRENFEQLRIRFRWTPQECTTGYLLIPEGEGPRPAVVTVYYEPETAIGLGNPNRDFAYQLARRGFVALSLGTTEATAAKTYAIYYPSIDDARVEPLSMLACAAANAWYVLAKRPEVDAKRIGIVGHSFGGKWAMFASCLFDKYACAVWSDPGIVFDESRPSVNYWEPWYLGYHPPPWRKRGVITAENPARGLYPRLVAAGHDLHELHALMAPRPFLVSGGSEDPPKRWVALNHTIAVNRLLGFSDRVAMTNRPEHSPNEQSNDQIYAFFEHFLQ